MKSSQGNVEIRLESAVKLSLATSLIAVTLWLGHFTYQDLYRVILDGFDRKLKAISTSTASFIDGDLHRGLEIPFIGHDLVLDPETLEADYVYQSFVQPMKQIRDQAGITYLYTQIPHENPDYCRYILDATEGEEHSLIGTEDELPPESSSGQRLVLNRGQIYLSPVRSWRQWGLLKVAFAPIFDRKGEISALAGADVNITVIREKTRAGLLRVLATGTVTLVIGLVVAVHIGRRIVGPVAKVREAALALAAGRHAESIEPGHLAELRDLAHNLNDVGGTLAETAARLERSDGALEEKRRLREMRGHLARRFEPVPNRADFAWRRQGGAHGTSTSDVVAVEGGLLIWLAPSMVDVDAATERRYAIRRALERVVPARDPLFRSAPESIVSGPEPPWPDLFPSWVGGFLFFPDSGDRLLWRLRYPLPVRRWLNGRTETRVLEKIGELELEGGALWIDQGDAASAGAPDAGAPEDLLEISAEIAGEVDAEGLLDLWASRRGGEEPGLRLVLGSIRQETGGGL